MWTFCINLKWGELFFSVNKSPFDCWFKLFYSAILYKKIVFPFYKKSWCSIYFKEISTISTISTVLYYLFLKEINDTFRCKYCQFLKVISDYVDQSFKAYSLLFIFHNIFKYIWNPFTRKIRSTLEYQKILIRHFFYQFSY